MPSFDAAASDARLCSSVMRMDSKTADRDR
jgi:hypothetical protein